MIVPVLLDFWQIECCGDPPGIGDAVSWTLLWRAGSAGSAEDADPVTDTLDVTANVTTMDLHGEPMDVRRDPVPTLLTAGELTAFWAAPAPPPATVRLTGLLYEDHHAGVPDETPRTTGRVQRVRIRTVRYVRAGREAHVVPGSTEHRDVRRAPKFFEHDLSGTDYRADIGVLVDLHVRASPPRR